MLHIEWFPSILTAQRFDWLPTAYAIFALALYLWMWMWFLCTDVFVCSVYTFFFSSLRSNCNIIRYEWLQLLLFAKIAIVGNMWHLFDTDSFNLHSVSYTLTIFVEIFRSNEKRREQTNMKLLLLFRLMFLRYWFPIHLHVVESMENQQY